MSDKNMNQLVSSYKEVLTDGEFQMTYQYLVSIIQNLRTMFLKEYKGTYTVSSVLHGYIDVTYFYLQNDLLKKSKLKLALVLNHQKAEFEIWLVAQTKEIQINYWQKMKNEKWVDSQNMPQYSIFERTLLENPDFNNKSKLVDIIRYRYEDVSNEIFEVLEAYI